MTVFDLDSHRRPRLSLDRAGDIADEVGSLAIRILNHLDQLDQKSRTATLDGYSTRSSSRLDVGGPTLTGDGHADPLGDAVAAGVTADADDRGPVRRAYRESSEALVDVVVMLRAAEGIAARALRTKEPATATEIGCVHHHEHGLFSATSNRFADLCDDCKTFMATHDGRRPARDELLEMEPMRLARELVRRRRASRAPKAA